MDWSAFGSVGENHRYDDFMTSWKWVELGAIDGVRLLHSRTIFKNICEGLERVSFFEQ